VNDGPEWFAPKRYGIGSGRPISWQGWALSTLFVGLVLGASLLLRREDRLTLIATIVTSTIVFLVIAAKTTRGGWRWRWGEED
jgi:hypothetical protein